MKTLIWDIEIMHSYDEAYQKRMYTSKYLDTGVRMSADLSHISHFGYKWEGGRGLCKDLTDFSMDEKELLKFSSDLFQQADHLVAHYGDKFDRRYVNAKLLHHGLPPIPPSPMLKQSDTCKLAKQHLKLSSNRLDNVAAFLGVPMKRKKNWPDDWIEMTKGNAEAFKRVKTYCIGDVETLEGVFLKLRPFASGSPNRAVLQRANVCIRCGGFNYVKNGFYHTKTMSYERFRCRDCQQVFHIGQWVKNGS